MTAILRYLTHPEVVIDPNIQIQNWGLSEIGHARTQKLIQSGALRGTTRIVTSAEQKARDTAEPIAQSLNAHLHINPQTHENDRSATGYLPADDFEATADAFFAHPDKSIRGWETANAAQARIVAELEKTLQDQSAGDILIVGHGGVGTLLYCHYAGLPIDRRYDQMPGGGCLFAMDIAERRVVHHWRRIEDVTP